MIEAKTSAAMSSRDPDGWFSAAYARARRQQIEAWSDELLKIADDPRLEPNDRRVRLDTRKWLMSKLHPARYGDKVTVAGDPDEPQRHVVSRLDVAKLSGPELDALERFTDARLAAKDVQDKGAESAAGARRNGRERNGIAGLTRRVPGHSSRCRADQHPCSARINGAHYGALIEPRRAPPRHGPTERKPGDGRPS